MAGSTPTAPTARQTGSLTTTHWIGIAAAIISALVHLALGGQFIRNFFTDGVAVSLAMGIAFLIATVGFVVGAWLVVVDRLRPTVYLLGIPFTAGQVVLWYVLNSPGLPAPPALSPLSGADKLAQLVLLAVLVVLYRRES